MLSSREEYNTENQIFTGSKEYYSEQNVRKVLCLLSFKKVRGLSVVCKKKLHFAQKAKLTVINNRKNYLREKRMND